MKKNNHLKAFTLFEIMIVVAILGLLAAIGIPAFQKARRNSTKSTLANDGRLLSSAAINYFLEYAVTQAPVTELYNSAAFGSSSKYMITLSKGVVIPSPTGFLNQGGTVALNHANFGTLVIEVDTGKTVMETLN